ncbi:general stress protein, partial [Xanthomonas citri pv. fuscans]|nr:general stress protein [Xanthomonas citri pv. fuscans]
MLVCWYWCPSRIALSQYGRRECAPSHALVRASSRLAHPRTTRMSGIEMADTKELQEKFWKALKSDRTVMLGLDGVE